MTTYTSGRDNQEVQDTGSELMLIARDSNHSHGPSVIVGSCRSQMISPDYSSAHSGPLGLWINIIIISSDSKYRIGTEAVGIRVTSIMGS